MVQKNLIRNIRYALLQMMFWSSAAAAYAFLTQLLEYKGFSSTQIGIINCIKLFSTMFFQIIIGSFSDKYATKFPLKIIIFVLSGGAFILTFILFVSTPSFFMAVIIFIGFGATFTCISPLIDAMAIVYENNGKSVNYVAGRAMGSVAWAVCCVGFGIFCDKKGVNNLLILQMVGIFVMAIAALLMEHIDVSEKSPDIVNDTKTVHSVMYLLTHYKAYTWFLIGSATMFMGYNLGTTFLIDLFVRIGGNNTHYGIAEFVMAISEVPSALIVTKCRKKVPVGKLMICCAFFMTLKNAFAACTDSVTVLILSQSCEMLGFGLFYAGSVYLVEDMLPDTDTIKGVSLINAATVGVGEGIGSLMCGVTRSYMGLDGLMAISVIVNAIAIVCLVKMQKQAAEVQ